MYIVIEIQKNSDGTVGNLVSTYETYTSAESAWHSILSVAATSQVEKHSAVLLSEDGFQLRHECYKHDGTQIVPTIQEDPIITDA